MESPESNIGQAMNTAAPLFDWRKMALPVYLPTLLFAIGEGAIIPIIPIVADGLGATLAIAGLIAAMIGATLVAIAGLGIATLAPNPVLLGLGILIVGIATAVFALARHAFMTTFVPQPYRARALSTLGGTFRLGYFIGPFLAAGVIALTGSTSAVFLIHVVGCVGAAGVLLLLRDPAATFGAGRAARHALTPGEAFVAEEVRGLFRTIWESRQVLSRLGTGAALIGALRASRAVILPLWAVSIGISDTRTAIIIGIAGGIDFALFYVSGQVMDSFGRLWAAVPSMAGLGAGHLVLAGSGALPGNVVWFIAVAMLLAVANGLGSGILMTLGADLADKRNPAPFLGAWRFTGDLGGAAAPLVIAAATAAFSLAVASSVMGVLGLLGAGVLLRYVPRFVPRERL